MKTERGAQAARVAAQAKVNLRLRVLAREASGYHQLETLFLRLDLADVVTVRRTEETRALAVTGVTDTGALGPPDRNLAWRAAESYLAVSRQPGGFAIELEKRIPVGGGLGGGSADAAAVLRGLNAIAPAPLSETTLLEIAARLGADVAFLASEHAFALAWGRGERLLGLPAPAARDVVLLVPSFGVNTAAAYGWLADARGGAAAGALQVIPAGLPVLRAESLSRWETLTPLAGNDFEPVVAARHPEVAQLVDALRAAGCAPALMSGSGSVVFGVLPARASTAMPPVSSGVTAMLTRTASRVEPVQLVE